MPSNSCCCCRWTQGRSSYLMPSHGRGRGGRGDIMAVVITLLLWSCSPTAATVTLTTQILSAPMSTNVTSSSSSSSSSINRQVQCPIGCQCTESSFVCVASANVTEPPSNISPTTLEYILSRNNFARVRADTFVGLNRLSRLDMSDNGIETLDARSLSGLRSLRELQLADNRLTSDGVDWSLVLLDSADQLHSLNVSRNSMHSVKAHAFRVLRSLAHLDLSSNGIVQLADDAFGGLTSLLTLDLSDNLIVDIRGRTFDGLDRLAELSLRGNRIQSFAWNALGGGGGVLRVLDLSFNRLESKSVADAFVERAANRLTRLQLRGNSITWLPTSFTRNMSDLQTLDLGANPIVALNRSHFSPGRSLREVLVDHMDELLAVLDDAFTDLPNLRLVNLSANVRLKHVSRNAFNYCPNLAVLDVSDGGLETVHGKLISSLTGLRRLALANNKWRCDCGLQWIASLGSTNPSVELIEPSQVKCSAPPTASNASVVHFQFDDDCSPAAIVHHSERVSFRLGSTALLECQVVGDPLSAIKWVTPRHEVLHWYPLDADLLDLRHSSFHDSDGVPVAESLLSRVQVLRNGNLFIGLVERSDAGSYLCLADNSLGAHSVKIAMSLDYDIIMHVKVVSILVGVATSIAFLLAALVARLVEMVLNRFGWCCCRGSLPPKAKHIKKMLESVEHYKKQQLDRLRDNYTMQVQRIKDNCNQQMERIRESYSQQTDRFRDIRDYGTQQLNCMRDQYCDQIKRVREYGVQQMSRVRENYVFQRNRVRKFRAHQLFKLRENYKVQQMHLNKILENMNLESCRTVCARTDSIVFTSETMESAFVGIVHHGPLKMPPADGDDILLSPFNFEMFDFAAALHDDDPFRLDYCHRGGGGGGGDDDDAAAVVVVDVLPDGSVPTLAFVTPPESPIGSVPNSQSSSDDSFADFDELVTCVVIPKSDGAKEDDGEPNTVIA